MGSELLRKYIDIINEASDLREHLFKMNKMEAGYVDSVSGPNHCSKCSHFMKPDMCELVEGPISPIGLCEYFDLEAIGEKWGKSTVVNPKEKGKYEGKTKEELLKAYHALKKSGPHHRGSPEFGRMRELAFAIRAKSGWGKVK